MNDKALEIKAGQQHVWVTIDGISIGFDAKYFQSVIRETPEYKEAVQLREELIRRP